MGKKHKDTDYLYISTRLRSLENDLLTRERMDRMIDAKTTSEAAKLLSECGYTGLDPINEASLNASLSAHREEVFREVSEYCTNKALVDVFRLKYDCHNAKALVKCQLTGSDASPMLVHAGMYDPGQLQRLLQGDENSTVFQPMKEALLRAFDVLSTTRDSQRSDLILDKACYGEMLRKAEESGSDFLLGYLRLQIDVLNLRSTVRILRRNKDMAFLKASLLPGGNVDREQIVSLCITGEPLSSLFTGDLQEAAALGDRIKRSGRQTEFEKACDNALCAYLKDCHRIPFGDGVVVAYLSAIETDITAARIIMSGRLSGIENASIRERLRDPYV